MKQKTIIPADRFGATIELNELTGAVVIRAMHDLASESSCLMAAFLRCDYEAIKRYLPECIETDLNLNQLGISEIHALWGEFQALNAPFFTLQGGTVTLAEAAQTGIEKRLSGNAISYSGPSASLPNSDMPTPPATAGDISKSV